MKDINIVSIVVGLAAFFALKVFEMFMSRQNENKQKLDTLSVELSSRLDTVNIEIKDSVLELTKSNHELSKAIVALQENVKTLSSAFEDFARLKKDMDQAHEKIRNLEI